MLTHITTLTFVILALIACDQQGGAIQYVEAHHEDHASHDDHDAFDANARLEEDCEEHEHNEQQFGEGTFLAPIGGKKVSDTEFVVKRAVKKQYRLINEEDCHDEHASEEHDEHAGEEHEEEHVH